jgi:hypothetical protein
VLDVLGASLGRGATAWLKVEYRRPVSPVPGVFKAEAWVTEVKQGGRRKRMELALSDGSESVLCTGGATHLSARVVQCMHAFHMETHVGLCKLTLTARAVVFIAEGEFVNTSIPRPKL